LTEYLYTVMTNPAMTVEPRESSVPALQSPGSKEPSLLARHLPHVRVGTISGLVELMVDMGAEQDVARLADRLSLPVDDFLSILEAATLLGFAQVSAGRVSVTAAGRDFATSTILRSKDIFREAVLTRVPIVATITKTLEEKKNKEMRADFFIDLLDEYYPTAEAKRQFETAVEWGRYAELFEYDAVEERLYVAASEFRS
jgi:NitT/TauT family transport system ATP-binding protein